MISALLVKATGGAGGARVKAASSALAKDAVVYPHGEPLHNRVGLFSIREEGVSDASGTEMENVVRKWSLRNVGFTQCLKAKQI